MGSSVPPFLLIFLSLVALTNAYKILVFNPSVSRSHLLFCGRVADALAKGGHEVMLLEPEYIPLASKLKTSTLAKRMIIANFSDNFAFGIKQFSTGAFAKLSLWKKIQEKVKYLDCFTTACRELLQKDALLEQLKAKKFDMIFVEHTTSCGSGLAQVLGIKTHIWMTSVTLLDHMSWMLSVPSPQSYVPTIADIKVTDRPSYTQRVMNLIAYAATVFVYRYGSIGINAVYREKYGQDFPDVDEIAKSSPIVFTAADEVVDFPRPGLPNVINIGGIGMSHKPKPLKEPLLSEMEKGQKGVVFFSFGSNVKTHVLPMDVKRHMVGVIALLPEYHFILKHDEEDKEMPILAKNLKNVYTTTWAPQTDILAHPRTKVFITHAGYNSMVEAAVAGVPVVAVPFFFDQVRNARVPERNGWGVFCSKMTLLEGSTELAKALKKVLENPEYKKNAVRTSKLVTEAPFSAEEKLLKYTNYVMQNDGRLPELQISGRDLDLIVYFNLDIFVPLVIVLLLAFVASIYALVAVLRCLCSRKVSKDKLS
ncbi:hypothetical protein L596_026588 [Steinernema carpocapsae]|uniref:UDP-glucuronosyltransferase n=1 Tax=Steinernema carpocapsae TaxID=34508 RepID=A0A4U5M1T4_STECR|nr:hypothetical protein L596_026588 [Steinernema carpocapsae]